MPNFTDMNHQPIGPKKVLHINNAAFALPDDFDGTIKDAMKLFLEYHDFLDENPSSSESIVDQSGLLTPLGILVVGKDKIRCCVEAKIYELDETGHYVERYNELIDPEVES